MSDPWWWTLFLFLFAFGMFFVAWHFGAQLGAR